LYKYDTVAKRTLLQHIFGFMFHITDYIEDELYQVGEI